MLVQGITHDLRNIFAIIIGNCELAGDTPTARHVLRIRQAAGRAAALLEADRSDAAKVDLTTPIDLNMVAREVSEMLRSTLVVKDKVRLQMELADDIPNVAGSSLWIFLSVFNLCLNARDAMIPAGGMLELTTSVKKTTVEFSVRDTGKGMSEKRLGSLWKPRLSPDRKHGHGLQIVRVSIARMGGTIDVQSKVGVGTTFTISLPALA